MKCREYGPCGCIHNFGYLRNFRMGPIS
jgi:hypothetical protein